jgi:LuxR family maltose regulon positive regulatory protein
MVRRVQLNQPVNLSKITPPSLPQILYRLRLLNLLEKNKDKKLILILGQAAQGKTTLAASYVKTSKIQSAWMNLDKEESDPVNLFHLIVQSLQYVLKEIDFSHLLSYPLGTGGERPEIPLYRDWTESIFKHVTMPIQIIIDGLDHLSSDAPAFKFLHILVGESPPNVHLILLSREMPPLSLEFQHLKIVQDALVLNNEDLAFTEDEIREFFKNVRRIPLNAAQLRKIYVATEGWIGALILFSESLSRLTDDSRRKFIFEDLPDHFRREVFQYFGKEIFSSQSEQVQQFLVKSSIIDVIESSFMKNFVGMEDAEEILRGFARRNLFIQPIYDKRKGWLFRYHQLFKDFLRARFDSEIGDEERRSLFLKAGTLYEQRGELENSVKYFLEAKAYPRAVSVIEGLGMDLLQKGRREDLSQWLLSLPEDMIRKNPWLLLFLAMTRRFMGGRENLVSLQKAHTLFKQMGDMRGILISLGQIIEVSVHTGIYLTPIESLIEEGEARLHRLELNQYQYESAVLWYLIAWGRIMGEGDIRKGIWACQNAYAISKQVKDISLQAYALCFSGFGLVLLGEFSLADETFKKIERVVEKSIYPEFKAIELMVHCILTNHRGDFTKAQSLVEELQGEIEKHGFVHMYPWVYEISGYLGIALGKFSEAEKIGKQYLTTAISLDNSLFRAFAYRLLGLIYLHQGDVKKAQGALERSISTFSGEAPSKYHLNRTRIIMGLLCSHLKDYTRGEKVLNEALQYFLSISSYISLVEVHLALAFLHQEQRKKDDAVFHLQTAFKIAEEKKYEYFYNLGMKYLTKACLLALELKVGGARDYASYLLSTRLSSASEEELKKLSDHPYSMIREKVWEIRKAIHRSKAPSLRIETLGGFRIFRGDSPMEEREWDRIQPKQLLKAILSHGTRAPKETLTEELWPEEKPKTTEKNFKTTLQRLRKCLEPAIDKYFGSSYVHLHDNIASLDPELCQVDVDRFLSLLKKGEEKEKRGDMKTALSFYTDAMELYKGEFLPEEFYAPWVDMKREELKGKYIDLLHRVAKILERQGALKKATECYIKVIQTDPLLEESYQNLMTLYSSKGMYNEALRVYEACKKALKAGLKSKPDSVTTALYNKILEKLHSD